MNKVFYQTILISLVLMASCKQTPKEKVEKVPDISDKFSIEILDDTGGTIIDPNASIQVLASGFEWTEGPLWIEAGNYLLFSDIPRNKVYKLNAENDTTTYLFPAGFTGTDFAGKEPGSNGLLLDPNGDLVLMQHGNRRVAKMDAPLNDPRPVFSVIADNFEGKKFNSPNDGHYDKSGNLYFTDPPYGLPGIMDDPDKELDFQGVYCLMASGELLLIDSLTRPNGVSLSPDEKVLYIAVSDETHAVWYAYDVIAPGKVENKRLFYDVTHLIGKEGEQGLPDGMKVNKKGYIFASGPGGIWIFDPSGKALARIHTGQKTANCAFSPDQKRLFMTADHYVLSVDLK